MPIALQKEKRLVLPACTRKTKRGQHKTAILTFSFDPKEISAAQKQAGLLA
jgi:hypothetical protein